MLQGEAKRARQVGKEELESKIVWSRIDQSGIAEERKVGRIKQEEMGYG